MKLDRLLLVSEPGRDGVFDYVAGLFAHLRQHHPDVTVDLAYSSNRGGTKLGQLVEAIRTAGGEAVDLKVGNAPQAADFQAGRKILRLVHERKPQLVHAHSSKAGALCRLLRAAWPGFPPVIYTPHAYFGLGGQKNPKTRVFNAIEAGLGRIGRTVNSSRDERVFGLESLHLPPRRLVLINNGIDTNRFHLASSEEKRSCREKLGMPADGLLLVTVGRDSFQKNYPPLYLAMDRILAEPSSRVFFAHAGAGSEAMRQTLSPAAQKRSLCFNHLEKVEELLFAADAFILTSRYEGLSLGALQAISCGLKVFLSRVTGNACLKGIGFHEISWVELGESEAATADALERSLCDWLADPRPPGADQITQARRSISAQIQLEKIHRLYTHLVDGKAA